MKKILLSLTMLISIASLAQETAIKLHIESLFFKELNINAERGINDNISLGVNVGIFMPRKIPKMFYKPPTDLGYVDTKELKNRMTGYNIVPEIRYYVGEKGPLHGFYLGGYLKVNNYKVQLTQTFNYTFSADEFANLDTNAVYYPYIDQNDKSIDATVDLELKLNQIGFGGQIGAQFNVGERVMIDFGIAGLGINFFNLKGTLTAVDVPVDYSKFTARAEEAINEKLNGVPIFKNHTFKGLSDKNSVSLSLPFTSVGYRAYFTVGFSF